ncbi:uncharacterized protein LOC106474339 [Limulus polyphemus]|uniref:Uncharacterized protein LOC106474339 n=1 Tax=Limulus polyphemus TaxID=6850 RepID=A0ABM1BXD9_LIMPO|nr:uncharacterized protein LOC106474339 [Limulus polyphemus]
MPGSSSPADTKYCCVVVPKLPNYMTENNAITMVQQPLIEDHENTNLKECQLEIPSSNNSKTQPCEEGPINKPSDFNVSTLIDNSGTSEIHLNTTDPDYGGNKKDYTLPYYPSMVPKRWKHLKKHIINKRNRGENKKTTTTKSLKYCPKQMKKGKQVNGLQKRWQNLGNNCFKESEACSKYSRKPNKGFVVISKGSTTKLLIKSRKSERTSCSVQRKLLPTGKCRILKQKSDSLTVSLSTNGKEKKSNSDIKEYEQSLCLSSSEDNNRLSRSSPRKQMKTRQSLEDEHGQFPASSIELKRAKSSYKCQIPKVTNRNKKVSSVLKQPNSRSDYFPSQSVNHSFTKVKKVSPLSVYTSIYDNFISSVTCKRFKRKSTKRKLDGPGNESFKKSCSDEQGQNIQIKRKKRNLKSQSPDCSAHNNVDEVVKDVINDIIDSVVQTNLNVEEDINFHEPSAREKSLLVEFCNEYGFDENEFLNLRAVLNPYIRSPDDDDMFFLPPKECSQHKPLSKKRKLGRYRRRGLKKESIGGNQIKTMQPRKRKPYKRRISGSIPTRILKTRASCRRNNIYIEDYHNFSTTNKVTECCSGDSETTRVHTNCLELSNTLNSVSEKSTNKTSKFLDTLHSQEPAESGILLANNNNDMNGTTSAVKDISLKTEPVKALEKGNSENIDNSDNLSIRSSVREKEMYFETENDFSGVETLQETEILQQKDSNNKETIVDQHIKSNVCEAKSHHVGDLTSLNNTDEVGVRSNSIVQRKSAIYDKHTSAEDAPSLEKMSNTTLDCSEDNQVIAHETIERCTLKAKAKSVLDTPSVFQRNVNKTNNIQEITEEPVSEKWILEDNKNSQEIHETVKHRNINTAAIFINEERDKYPSKTRQTSIVPEEHHVVDIPLAEEVAKGNFTSDKEEKSSSNNVITKKPKGLEEVILSLTKETINANCERLKNTPHVTTQSANKASDDQDIISVNEIYVGGDTKIKAIKCYSETFPEASSFTCQSNKSHSYERLSPECVKKELDLVPCSQIESTDNNKEECDNMPSVSNPNVQNKLISGMEEIHNFQKGSNCPLQDINDNDEAVGIITVENDSSDSRTEVNQFEEDHEESHQERIKIPLDLSKTREPDYETKDSRYDTMIGTGFDIQSVTEEKININKHSGGKTVKPYIENTGGLVGQDQNKSNSLYGKTVKTPVLKETVKESVLLKLLNNGLLITPPGEQEASTRPVSNKNDVFQSAVPSFNNHVIHKAKTVNTTNTSSYDNTFLCSESDAATRLDKKLGSSERKINQEKKHIETEKWPSFLENEEIGCTSIKDKIARLRREIFYLDLMADQKEKEKLLIEQFKKQKEEKLKRIYQKQTLLSNLTNKKMQKDKRIATSPLPLALSMKNQGENVKNVSTNEMAKDHGNCFPNALIDQPMPNLYSQKTCGFQNNYLLNEFLTNSSATQRAPKDIQRQTITARDFMADVQSATSINCETTQSTTVPRSDSQVAKFCNSPRRVDISKSSTSTLSLDHYLENLTNVEQISNVSPRGLTNNNSRQTLGQTRFRKIRPKTLSTIETVFSPKSKHEQNATLSAGVNQSVTQQHLPLYQGKINPFQQKVPAPQGKSSGNSQQILLPPGDFAGIPQKVLLSQENPISVPRQIPFSRSKSSGSSQELSPFNVKVTDVPQEVSVKEMSSTANPQQVLLSQGNSTSFPKDVPSFKETSNSVPNQGSSLDSKNISSGTSINSPVSADQLLYIPIELQCWNFLLACAQAMANQNSLLSQVVASKNPFLSQDLGNVTSNFSQSLNTENPLLGQIIANQNTLLGGNVSLQNTFPLQENSKLSKEIFNNKSNKSLTTEESATIVDSPIMCKQSPPAACTTSTAVSDSHVDASSAKKITDASIKSPACGACGAKDPCYICSGCQKEWYCSMLCQFKNWTEHSKTCRKV